MMTVIPHGVSQAAWVFFALGPQLAVCLLLGYLAARRCAGSMINWLAAAFLVSLIPLLGVLVMLLLWQRSARPTAARADPGDANVTGPAKPAATAARPPEPPA